MPNRVAGDTVSSTWDGWHDQGTEVKGNMDVRYDVPLYTLTDIGRFLDLAPSTLHYWVHEKGIVRHLPRTGRGEPYLPFAAVAEAQFTQSLRRAGLQLQAVVEGVTQLRKELGHNWLSADLSHDGVDVLRRYADAGHPTWARVRDGQGASPQSSRWGCNRSVLTPRASQSVWCSTSSRAPRSSSIHDSVSVSPLLKTRGSGSRI